MPSQQPKYNVLKYVQNAILNHFKKLLTTVKTLYPKELSDEIITSIFKNIKSNFKFFKLTESRRERLTVSLQKKKFKRIIKCKGVPLHSRNPAIVEIRCIARIWAEGRIIKSTDGSYIYGQQCYRKKAGESSYCFQHQKKNTHGDFNKSPKAEIIYDFHKFSKVKI